MKPVFIENTSNLSILTATVKEIAETPEIKSILVLSCDKNELVEKDFKEIVRMNIPVFGGVFPQIIYNQKHYDRGLLLIGLNREPHLTILKNISDENVDFEEILDADLVDEEYHTGIVFVDGFANSIDRFIEGLFNTYGIEINYVGGGAGSLDMVQKPCIITPEGIFEDAAVLAAFKTQSGIGVRHGWESLSGPYKVSHSVKNRIYMLENQTAFEIYKNVVEKDSGREFNENNFFELAKGYPFGISKIGTEKIVRDPILLHSDGSLQCVGDVPQNTFVHILKGKRHKLIEAANEALEIAKEDLKEYTQNESIFFIDCISRMLYLEDAFSDEIETIGKHNANYFGALTLGEIANSGKDYLEFYNKTAVVAIIKDI